MAHDKASSPQGVEWLVPVGADGAEDPTRETLGIPDEPLMEEITDVVDVRAGFEATAVSSNRQLVVTVLSGPQIGLARAVGPEGLVLGRGQGCDLVMADQGMSRVHCRIIVSNDVAMLEDLHSRNGTSIGGVKVKGPVVVSPGSRFSLGRNTVIGLSLQDSLEQEAARQLYDSSMRDALTGLHNRRVFDQRLCEEHAFATRHHAGLSVVLLDLDHFKAVNDTYGHQAGDQVLRHVAAVVKRCVRQEDVAARFGGEEFVCLMRTDSHQGARAVAERMRARVFETPTFFEGRRIPITVSAGVATNLPPGLFGAPGDLLAAADRALYRAKGAGRNRCEG